jgi:Rab5 GDP/GTP exchange factor
VSGMSRTLTQHLEITGIQEEIDSVRENVAAAAAKETLRKISPSMDIEVVEWVLEANGGDVGKSVEALLEMSGGG